MSDTGDGSTTARCAEGLTEYLMRGSAVADSPHPRPLFLRGDAARSSGSSPRPPCDCVVTSPPYFGHRRYAGGGIGAEGGWRDYVAAVGAVTAELLRVLRPTGSLWLNLGDTYRGKRQLGIPWRVAFHLADEQGWTLRNSVVWHKVKGGPDTSRDKLRNVHELLFHFVRQPRGYYYDADAVRSAPREARVENGAVVSATGVSGVRYRRQIELSTALDDLEKAAALAALEETLDEVSDGRLADFRMVVRGRQRATHSDVGAVSGRARELEERGFYFLRYHPGGAKPGDVWDILPEDTQGRGPHFAPVPGRPVPHPHPRHLPAGRRRARSLLRDGDGDAGGVASSAAGRWASTSPRSTSQSRARRTTAR